MAAILNSAMLDSDTAILDSDTLFSSLRLTQKHSPSSLTLTQCNSIWLKLIHSDSTWSWQPSWILPSWIQPYCTKKSSLVHSDSISWWQPSWTLPSWIQTLPSWNEISCYLLSDSLKNTLPPLWLWLKLIQSDKLDDGNHLEFCHLEFCHLGFSHFAQSSDSNQLNLTHTHSFSLNLMISAILNSAILDSDTALLDSNTLLSSLRFTQKHCHSILALTQTNSIWLKLIHSHLTWWWQSSWISPSSIQPC